MNVVTVRHTVINRLCDPRTWEVKAGGLLSYRGKVSKTRVSPPPQPNKTQNTVKLNNRIWSEVTEQVPCVEQTKISAGRGHIHPRYVFETHRGEVSAINKLWEPACPD